MHIVFLIVTLFFFCPKVYSFDEEKYAQICQKFADLPEEKVSDSKKFQTLCDAYWDLTMITSPEYATFVGYPGQNRYWSKYKPQDDSGDEFFTLICKALDSVNPDQLSPDEALSYELLKQSIAEWKEELPFKPHYLCVDQMHGVHLSLSRTLSMMPTESEEQYADIIVRLKGVEKVVDDLIELLREGIKEGITPPRITLRDVPEQVLGQITSTVEESAFYLPFTQLPEDSILKLEGKEAIEKHVFPALKKLHDFLVEEYLPGSRETIAMSDLPNGREWYELKVRKMTTSSHLTADKVHRIGLEEVNRIKGEMEKIMAKVGFSGTILEFSESLDSRPDMIYPDQESVVLACASKMKAIEAKLPLLFGKIPQLPCEVVPIPAYSQKSQAGGFYVQGSIKKGRPGYFYVNTYDLKEMSKWKIDALILHEALPGHHLQITLAQELKDVPIFRQYLHFTSFIEGWGLYAESLGEELGCYTDPYAQFGRLSFEMRRAVRLVLDTGLHALGWTREQAIEYFVASGGATRYGAEQEVDRFLVMPGQALSYKIGELKFKELRQKAKDALGDRFDIREFHDQLLSLGAVPLDTVEKHIEAWISKS